MVRSKQHITRDGTDIFEDIQVVRVDNSSLHRNSSIGSGMDSDLLGQKSFDSRAASRSKLKRAPPKSKSKSRDVKKIEELKIEDQVTAMRDKIKQNSV